MTRSHRPVLLLLLSLVPATVFLGAGTVWNLEAERVRARDEAEGFARRAARAAGERLEREREVLLHDALADGRRLLERGEAIEPVDVRMRPLVVVWDRDDRRVHPAPGRMLRRDDVLAGLPAEWRRELDLYTALLARGDVDEARLLAKPWVSGGAPDVLVAVAVALEARARFDAGAPDAAAALLSGLREDGGEAALPTAQRLWGMQVELARAGGDRAAEERIAARAAEVIEPLLHDRVGLAPTLAEDLAARFTVETVRRDFTARMDRARDTGRRLAQVAAEGPPPIPVGVWDRPQRVAVGEGWGASMRISDARDNLVGRVLAVAPSGTSPEVADLEAASWDVEFLESPGAAGVADGPLVVPLGGYLAGSALLLVQRDGDSPFPWRTAMTVLFLVSCLGLIAGGVVLTLRSVRREQQLVDMRSEFLAEVSHQLKTPVANLRMFAETLSSGRVDDAGDRRRMEQILHIEASKLGEYLERILAVARLDRGSSGGEPDGPVDLGETMERLRERWSAAAAARDVSVSFGGDGELPAAIGDADALLDGLHNVIDNAVRHSPSGGTVRVEASSGGGRIRIAVADEGGGIAPEDVPHVFERFYRGAGGRAGEGTGLGLAIARAGAERAGGTCEIERTDHDGTVVVFDLPAVRGDA